MATMGIEVAEVPEEGENSWAVRQLTAEGPAQELAPLPKDIAEVRETRP